MSYRTANLQMLHFIYYSTNIRTEYFKHAAHSPFFFLSSKCHLFHNANIFGSCVIHILYTVCAKIKKKNSGAKGLRKTFQVVSVLKKANVPIHRLKLVNSRSTTDEENVYLQNTLNVPRTRQHPQHKCMQI